LSKQVRKSLKRDLRTRRLDGICLLGQESSGDGGNYATRDHNKKEKTLTNTLEALQFPTAV
jgi:hypothetical protein